MPFNIRNLHVNHLKYPVRYLGFLHQKKNGELKTANRVRATEKIIKVSNSVASYFYILYPLA